MAHEIRMEEKKVPLIFECSYTKGDEIWFSARDFNGLFQGNLITGEVTFLSFFSEVGFLKKRLHSKIIEKDNRLFFAPEESDYFHVYDLQTGEMQAYRMKEPAAWKYQTAYEWKNDIYLIPHKVKSILRFSANEKSLRSIDMRLDDWLAKSTVRKDAVVYATMESQNYIVEINLDTESVHKFPVGVRGDKFLILAIKGNALYLKKEASKEILVWDITTKKIVARHIVSTQIYFSAVQHKDLVVGNSRMGDGVQTISIDRMQPAVCRREPEMIPFSFLELTDCFVYRDELWYLWSGDGKIYNARTNELLTGFYQSKELLESMKEKTLEQKRLVFEEGDCFSLKEYAAWLKKNRQTV